jgi:hypothetical protein
MKREVAESIVGAMKEVERKRMLIFIAGVIHDSHMEITLPVVKHVPDLHPDVASSRRY